MIQDVFSFISKSSENDSQNPIYTQLYQVLEKNYPMWRSEGEIGSMSPEFFEAVFQHYLNFFYEDEELKYVKQNIYSISKNIDKYYIHYKSKYQKIRTPFLIKQYCKVHKISPTHITSNKEFIKFKEHEDKKILVNMTFNEHLF